LGNSAAVAEVWRNFATLDRVELMGSTGNFAREKHRRGIGGREGGATMIMGANKKRIAARNRDVQDRAVEEGLAGLVIGGAKAFDDMDDATLKRLDDELYAYFVRERRAGRIA
jgi:hypothetical protein